MKRFACGDVVAGCSWVHNAGSEEQLFDAIKDHAARVHGIVELSPELMDSVKKSIGAID